MSEFNHLSNGRFLHGLGSWAASGAAYSAGDGDDHYGVAVLSTGGGSVEQPFSVPHPRTYTLHLAVKAVGGDLSGSQATASIVDGEGNTVTARDLSGAADTWTENAFAVGLAPGTTYTLRITNAGAAGDVKLDDVWLWHVPISRAALAERIHAKLGRLASERSLSAAASGADTEGDYTAAVDSGLRTVNAIHPGTGLPDARCVEPGMVDTALEAVEREMLEQLYHDYAAEVDVRVGPREEALSQKRESIRERLGGGRRDGVRGTGSGGRIVTAPLRREAEDYDF